MCWASKKWNSANKTYPEDKCKYRGDKLSWCRCKAMQGDQSPLADLNDGQAKLSPDSRLGFVVIEGSC